MEVDVLEDRLSIRNNGETSGPAMLRVSKASHIESSRMLYASTFKSQCQCVVLPALNAGISTTASMKATNLMQQRLPRILPFSQHRGSMHPDTHPYAEFRGWFWLNWPLFRAPKQHAC